MRVVICYVCKKLSGLIVTSFEFAWFALFVSLLSRKSMPSELEEVSLLFGLINSHASRCTPLPILYGPTDDRLKPTFLDELTTVRNLNTLPWLLVGDFNLLRRASDTSGGNANLPSMLAFNALIARLSLSEVQLTGRQFTWSNHRPNPTLSKLDRAFLSHDWLSLPILPELSDLLTTTSNHAPLLLSIAPSTPVTAKTFKFETFWLRFLEVHTVVRQAWNTAVSTPDQTTKLLLKFQSACRALSQWASQKFAKTGSFLHRSKLIIRFLDLIEEQRRLNRDEFTLRISLKEHVQTLIQVQEEKWKQRSSCTWLRLGDKNTKYFHALANTRRMSNHISSIALTDRLVTMHDDLKDTFRQYFYSTLGTQPEPPPPFDLTGKVGTRRALHSLGEPFSEEEITKAVNDLPQGKASGPDGFPIEFFKAFWEIIKLDIFQAIASFQEGRLNLNKLNKATITLVPKVPNPSQLTDFRPISVINTFVKIISKTMANRLQAFILDLVSPLQTAFTKGKSIMESYMVARELLSYYHRRKIPAILYKVDFTKAFDTISWTFLTNLLVERGFPPQWISCLLSILRSSSSRISVNGDLTASFFHKRGLRQGDPSHRCYSF